MSFYLGALRMLNIAAGYSNNTLYCSELNGEHAGEGFRSLRHILTPLWACKDKKCHFSRKFDFWPDLSRSNFDLGLKTIWAIARSRRGASTGFFREALRPSGADRQGGGGSYQPPPPDRPRYEKCPDRARVNSLRHGDHRHAAPVSGLYGRCRTRFSWKWVMKINFVFLRKPLAFDGLMSCLRYRCAVYATVGRRRQLLLPAVSVLLAFFANFTNSTLTAGDGGAIYIRLRVRNRHYLELSIF